VVFGVVVFFIKAGWLFGLSKGSKRNPIPKILRNGSGLPRRGQEFVRIIYRFFWRHEVRAVVDEDGRLIFDATAPIGHVTRFGGL